MARGVGTLAAPMLNILIVDDEPLAHEVLLHHCRAHADVRVVGRCHSAAQALTALETLHVDLMLLDIRMPRFGGLELLRGLVSPPLTVIVSAHKEHALDGFELDVVDYLLKPVSEQRFASALTKIRRRFAEQKPTERGSLVLKVDRAMRRFVLDEIACFEAHGNFVKLWTADGVVLATTTLRRLLEQLPSDDFVQTHKSYIVNRAHVVEQRIGAVQLADGMQVPIGKNYRAVRVVTG